MSDRTGPTLVAPIKFPTITSPSPPLKYDHRVGGIKLPGLKFQLPDKLWDLRRTTELHVSAYLHVK